MLGMRKLSLSNFWPTCLAVLIGIKNHGVLETWTKIQFHHNNWAWLIPNLEQIGKFSFQENWTWIWMWPRSPTLWFNSNFWVYVDFSILTWFGCNSWTNIDSCTHRAWNWTTNLESHSIDGKRTWISIFRFETNSWTKTYSRVQSWFFRVSISSQTFHFKAQIFHSTKSHSTVGHKHRP